MSAGVRGLAETLARAAARAAPADRSEWATAMLAEVDHIAGDHEALLWAAGSLFASCGFWLETTEIGRGPLARLSLALLVLVQTARALFAPVMVLSWRLGAVGITAALGAQTAGDDYRRFIPLIRAVPDAALFADLASAALFAVAALSIRRGRSAALLLFLGAVGLDMAAVIIGQMSPDMQAARAATFTFATHNFRRDVLVPLAGVLYPIALMFGLWWVSRPRRTRA